MNTINKFIYFAYYLKVTDWGKFRRFTHYVADKKGYSQAWIILDAIRACFKYKVSLLDYFYFRFYELDQTGRDSYAGTGFMYEYHKEMNPLDKRDILSNKILFFQNYSEFVIHRHCTIQDIEQNNERYQQLKAASPKKLVLKDALGQCGWSVEVVPGDISREELLQLMNEKGFNLLEQFVQQHSELARLSDTGLNTIRMVTQLDENNKVQVLGALLRISINSFVDNIAMGNIAAPINLVTGRIDSAAVYSDITKPQEEVHPITKEQIVGFQVPFWTEALSMIERAALHRKQNRSIGWDVAITEAGPSLIEGNHNWCKLLWQLPNQRGMKSEILKYYTPA